MGCFKLNGKAMAYAATSLGGSMVCAVFDYYSVKVFLNHFKVTEGWFQASQMVFMLWNTVTGPLFGYMQDNLDYYWAKSRQQSILHGAPLVGFAFMMAWFPWSRAGFDLSGPHYMITLCLFSGALTFVALAHSSLFAELSREHNDRVRLIKYCQYAGIFGSSSVFFCGYFSRNLEKFYNFQLTCTIIAILATLCMMYTALRVKTECEKPNISSSNLINTEDSDSTPSTLISSLMHFGIRTWQVIKERDFLSFVSMNFLQTYHSVFLSAFAMIICDQLIRKDVFSSITWSVIYGSLSIAPQIAIILLVPIVQSTGYYRVIRASFLVKICLGFSFMLMGPRPYYVIGYFFIDSVCCKAPLYMATLILSDIIDKDKTLNQREQPISSTVFAANILVTSPAFSLAPIITVAILNRYGYELVKTDKGVEPLALAPLHEAMFHLTCITSIVVGVLQLISWSRYTIRNSYEVSCQTEC